MTGLSRAGKTVFVSALVHHLLHPGRLPGLSVMTEERFDAAILRPSPSGAVPRFPYEDVLRRLIGSATELPAWPDGTRAVSELRLSIRFRSPMALGFERDRTLHLDIVDYPGEWLLDLPLLELDYATWSRQAWRLAERGDRAALSAAWRSKAEALASTTRVNEPATIEAAAAFRDYLKAARAAPQRYAVLQPGRFLLPGELEGAPALTFFPLPDGQTRGGRDSLARLMADRFESYKRDIVRPFFDNHLCRIDRQAVLVDLLEHLAAGQESLADLKQAIDGTLGAFRHGENGWLSLLFGRKIDRVLFAATKADHLHGQDHARLTSLLASLVDDTARRMAFGGTAIRTEALAALRVTEEVSVPVGGRAWPGIVGLPMDADREENVLPGYLPAGLEEAHGRGDLAAVAFRPRPGDVQPGRGMPSLRFDRAVEFLLGDRLA